MYPPTALVSGDGQGRIDIARQIISPATALPEPTTSPPRPSFSPCQRLWARYHAGPERDKVEILEELIENGCLERARRSIAGPDVPVT